MKKEYIGLKDRHDNKIHVGDVVRFVVNYDFQDPPQPEYDTDEGAEMIDEVVKTGNEFYFRSLEGFGKAYAHTHNNKCEIIEINDLSI